MISYSLIIRQGAHIHQTALLCAIPIYQVRPGMEITLLEANSMLSLTLV